MAADPPPGLARKVAERESASEAARSQFAFTQKVLIEEMAARGSKAGEFRETREVVLLKDGERTEVVRGKTTNTLQRLQLTNEDFRDLREIQPLMITADRLWLYTSVFRGEETAQDTPCWVLEVRPRQILDGQRLFEGLLWVAKSDFSVVQTEGRAVPQILGTKQENLFPRFRTIRHRMEGGFWFPFLTLADDTLPFRNGPLRMKMRLEYNLYQRFGTETVIRFDLPAGEEKRP